MDQTVNEINWWKLDDDMKIENYRNKTDDKETDIVNIGMAEGVVTLVDEEKQSKNENENDNKNVKQLEKEKTKAKEKQKKKKLV